MQGARGLGRAGMILLLTVGVAGAGDRALPAFPGAEGFGAVSVGGRGGRVIKVTNLKPKGPGSLQWALEQPGPRIIVFEVSGVIVPPHVSKGRRYLSIHHSNVTIAGQTAPGAGITINGMLSTRRGRKEKTLHDVTIRFLRVRPTAAKGSGRNLRALELDNCERIIVDHVSGSWSKDDCFELYSGKDATVQWCASEESDIWLEGGDEPHNFGMITGYHGPRPITVHHTLLAHHRSRTPLSGSFPFDFRNNVLYNSGEGMLFIVRANESARHSTNIVGNYSKAGPGGMIGVRIYRPPYTAGRGPIKPYRKGNGRFYLDGNYMDWLGGYVEPWKRGRPRKNVVDKEFADYPKVSTHTAEEAHRLVAAAAGCLPRDAVSKRTIRELRTRGGSWGCHIPDGGLMEGLEPGDAPPDSDGDGMPDDWETEQELDPNDPADAKKTVPKGASPGDRHAGYTYVEYYVNDCADRLVAGAFTHARLDVLIPKDGGFRAGGLSPMAEHHGSLAAMLAAIKDQNMARQNAKDRRTREDTDAAWLAVQQLSRLGAKAKPAVPKLIEMLEADDRRTATFAAWALGAIGRHAKEAVPALSRALEKDWKARHGKWDWCPVGFAAWALGRIGNDAAPAAPALAGVLSGGKHPWATDACLWALTQMDARPAMDVLLARVEHPHAATALANIGEPAVPGLQKALSDTRPGKLIGALRALHGMGPKMKPAVPRVIELTRHDDPRVRVAALRALNWAAGRDTVAAVKAALEDPDTNVRRVAVRTLGAIADTDDKAVVDALAARFRTDPRREVRAAAAETLARPGEHTLRALTEALASDKDPFVRRHAARALRSAGEGAVPALVKALKGQDAGVRREAVWSLASLGAGSDALKEMQDDPDYVVRYAAAEVLRRMKEE